MNELDENQKNLIKIGLYGGFFLIVVIFAAISSRTGNTNNSNNSNDNVNQNNPIIEKLKNINENYYTAKIHLTLDDDAEMLEYQKIDEIEIGVKKYHGESIEYAKYLDNYYKIENQDFKKILNFKDFDYDKTFMRIENIHKLLEKTGTISNYQDNDSKIIKIEYKLIDAIETYNEYNNANVVKYTDDSLALEIHYKEEDLEYILIDTTNLYNLINETNQESVIYKIEIKENKEEDNSWLKEKLN